MRVLVARLSTLLSFWVFKPVLALVAARFVYAFIRAVFKYDPGSWLATTLFSLTSHDGIEIGRWSALGLPALMLLAWYEARRAPPLWETATLAAGAPAGPLARVIAKPKPFNVPDSPIRYAFHFVHPAPFHSYGEKERVGNLLIAKFASGALRAWGREMVGKERLPLAEIPKGAWHKSRFTYWFLDEGPDNQDICHVECSGPQSTGAPLLYTDLRVNRDQLRAVWTGPAPSRRENEWRSAQSSRQSALPPRDLSEQ